MNLHATQTLNQNLDHSLNRHLNSHRTARLANGLEIQAEVDPLAHTAAVGFFVRTGARDEPTELMGVSHFLEHMMFKGSETRGALDVNRDFDELGASHNAFTTSELTAYYAHVLPDRVSGALEVLADILRPSLRSKDFDEEKGVILEEIAMYADQPFWVGYEAMMEHLYHGHPLSHRVLGTTATVSALARDQMASYFAAHYSADNTVLVAAGNVDFDALVRDAERLCGHWTAARPSRTHPAWSPNTTEAIIRLKNTARAYVLLSLPGPAIQDDRRYAAGILMHILGGGDGSRLHWALVETGIAEEASASYDGHDGMGDSTLFAVCDVEKVAEIEAILRRELNALVDSLTEDDLLRARSRIATGAAAASERPNGRMFRLGTLWGYGADYIPLEAEVDRISHVTLDDLRACSRDFPLDPKVKVVVLPTEDETTDTAVTLADGVTNSVANGVAAN
ncbi:MAG: insulinase family protein [Planctomycetota bacterium]|nr:MAG: insulinase family protein [Planctomycetota bacterium]